MRFGDFENDMDGLVKRYELSINEGRPGYFDVDELEDISEFYRSLGKDKESTDVIELGLKLHPNNSILLLRRATLFADIGNYKRALMIIDRLPEKEDTDIVLLRAEIYLHINKEQEGLLLLHELFEDDSSDKSILALDISSLLSELSMYREAEEFLLNSLENDENNIELIEELAFCYEQNKKYRLAVDLYERILDLDPYFSEIWFNLGQAWFNLEEFEKAVEAYDFALTISESDGIARLQKAHALFQSGRFMESANAYQEYMDYDERNDYLLVFQGEAYEKAGFYDEALVCYSDAYEKNNENFEACTGLAICNMEKKEFQKSLSWFDKALKLNEEDPELWVYIAELMILMELKEEAYVSYLRSLTLKKDQPDVLAAMGNISFDMGEYEKALDLYKIAFSIDPELPGIDLFFALTYAKLGLSTIAQDYLIKAKEKDVNADKIFKEIMESED